MGVWETSRLFSHIFSFMLSLSQHNGEHDHKSLISSPAGSGGANKWPMSPRDLPVSEAQRVPREESWGGCRRWGGGGRGERGGQTEMRYCLGFVKEVCCARGFKVGGGRNMCWGTEVGGQSNDSAATTARYPRQRTATELDESRGIRKGRLLVSRG